MAPLLGRYAISAVVGLTGLVVAGGWWGARMASAHPRISTTVTWRADIQPLFARHCLSCHGTQAIVAPLTTYREARPWAAAIREELLERRMPPAQGVPGVDAGVDDHRLSPMERDLIVAWIDGGAPETLPGGMRQGAVFWCRMHPEIRADRAGPCPLCGMALSPFVPDLTRRYAWTVRPAASASASAPATAAAADDTARRVTLTIEERTNALRARPALELVHEHPLHLFIVSDDFRSFAHVHPTSAPDAAGRDTWSIAWRPPAAGRYWFYGDFLPVGGAPQMLHRMITVGRPPAARAMRAPRDREVLVASAAGLRATLTRPTLRAGDSHRLTMALTDASTGAPVTDLQPYLGAWGHLFVLREQHDEAVHAHPDSAGTTAGGPAIAFDVLFPRAGLYHLWTQVQRRGTIVTLPFIVRVEPRA